MARITDRSLSKKPTDKSIWLYDDSKNKGHGELCARINPGGSRRFYFRYTDQNGKRVRLSLGSYDPDGVAGLTLKAARTKAGELSMLHQEGVSDIKGHLEDQLQLEEARRLAEEASLEAERKAAEIEASRMSVAELFEKWEKQRLSKRKDGKEIRRLFEKDVMPEIGNLPAHTIRKGHIMQIIDVIEKRGALRVAKIVFTNLRTLFRFALVRDFIEIDPTATINKADVGGKEVERDRVLDDEEIKLLAKQLEDADLLPTAQAAIWICLSAGCRIGELIKAKWEHIDFEAKRWLIPSENSKNGLPLEVNLSEFTLRHFKIIEQHRQSDEWLYPARNKSRDGLHLCTKTITKQVTDRQRLTAMKGRSSKNATLVLPGGHWTIHDLRRTASTIMGDLGIKPEIIDRCLNHKEQNRVRRTYQRYSYQSEMKEAWELLGKRLQGITAAEDVAVIIPMQRGA